MVRRLVAVGAHTGELQPALHRSIGGADAPAAYALLGWQLSGDYTMGAPEVVDARGASDSDSTGEVGLRIPPPPPAVHVRASAHRTVARQRMHVRVARRIAAGR